MTERLIFARSLYLPEAVDAAREAYRELAKIAVVLRDDEIEVSVEDSDPEVADVLADELANYVLGETVRRLRGGP